MDTELLKINDLLKNNFEINYILNPFQLKNSILIVSGLPDLIRA